MSSNAYGTYGELPQRLQKNFLHLKALPRLLSPSPLSTGRSFGPGRMLLIEFSSQKSLRVLRGLKSERILEKCGFTTCSTPNPLNCSRPFTSPNKKNHCNVNEFEKSVQRPACHFRGLLNKLLEGLLRPNGKQHPNVPWSSTNTLTWCSYLNHPTNHPTIFVQLWSFILHHSTSFYPHFYTSLAPPVVRRGHLAPDMGKMSWEDLSIGDFGSDATYVD